MVQAVSFFSLYLCQFYNFKVPVLDNCITSVGGGYGLHNQTRYTLWLRYRTTYE